MIITTDTETYMTYNGKNYNEILNNQRDPETFPKEQELKKGNLYPVLNSQSYTIGVTIDENKKITIHHSAKEHWNYIITLAESLANRAKNLTVYAHEHRYDFLAYAREHLFDKEMRIIIERPLYATYKNITFVDTMSFYPMSLEKLGNLFNMKKLVMPISTTNEKELVQYCTQDTLIVLESVLQLKKQLQTIGFNPRKLLTGGQLAMTTFQTWTRNHNTHYVYMHSGETYRSKNVERLRYALRGARCQAFKKGRYENTTLIDINSMYTHAMITMDFPDLRYPLELQKPSMNDWKQIRELTGVIECTMQISTTELPFLMAYTKITGKDKPVTVFPSQCRIRGHWTIPEINYALSIPGHEIVNIHWAEVYKKSKINPFKDYLLMLYDLGIKDPRMKATSKILRNNLYGKWGQRRDNNTTKIVYRADATKELLNGWTIHGYHDDKVVLIKKDTPYIAKYTNPLISALITATARIYHYEQLKKIPCDDLLYCDSDSILYKGKHDGLFDMTPDKLGAFKIEDRGTAIIKGRKRYFMNNKAKISGLQKRITMNEKTFSDNTMTTTRAIGIRDGLRANRTDTIGTFRRVQFDMNGIDIDSLPLPKIIDEREHYT